MATEDYKKKYIEYRALYKQEKVGSQESVEILRNAIAKMSVAIDGIDPKLDRQVAALRRDIRDGVNHHKVTKQIETISNIIRHLGYEKKGVVESSNLQPLVKQSITNVLNHSISDTSKKKLSVFSSKLNGLTDNEIYNTYLNLLEEALTFGPASGRSKNGHKETFWSRLTKNDEPKTLASIVSSLVNMLENLTLEDEHRTMANQIRDNIKRQFSFEEIPETLQQISDLITQAAIVEKESFDKFLSQVNGRLTEVQSHLTQSTKEDAASLKASKLLEGNIQSSALDLKDKFESISSMDDLTALIDSGLGKILENVNVFHQHEQERAQEKLEKIQTLEQRLTETERNADTLRDSLSQQKRRAMIDPLTKVYNREAYNERIIEVIERHKRYETEYVIAVCDVDFFKKVNDDYGHLAGDKVLTSIAAIIKDNIRKLDFIARYGGEEFVLLLEKINIEVAERKLNDLRQRVADLDFHFRKKPVPITVSIGATAFKPTDTEETAFERADKALYKAKESGRNQVIIGK